MPLTSNITKLAADVTTRANHFDPEFTYYADGTRVVMRSARGEKRGVTFGMTTDSLPYQFQAVRWDDGSEDAIAPHVLHRDEESTETDVPAVREARDCARCDHSLNDVAGYVVAYSHIEGGDVTFTDIAYLEGDTQYGRAQALVHEARAKVASGQVSATYAVVHTVYVGGHRPA